MGSIIHDLSGAKDNHVSFGLRYPNQVAMELGQDELDGQILADRHLGKTAIVLDTNRRFSLLQHDPTIVFQPEDAPAPLLDALDIYLDAGAGNDLTGDGTSGSPYKTFDRAFQVLENKRINKRVKIRPAAGVYDSFPETVYFDIAPGGDVIIDASGETYPVVAGPFTIDSVAGVGPANNFGNHEATDLTVTGTPGWTPDQFYGKFVHFTGGNYSNRVINAWSNTADTVRVMMDLFTFQAGDTFNVVDCPVKIQVDHPVRFFGQRITQDPVDYFNPTLVIAGVNFEIDSGTIDHSPLSFNGLSVILNYSKLVDMWTADNYSVCVLLNGTKLNLDFVSPGTLDNSELEEWINYSFQVQSLAGTSPTQIGIDVVSYGSSYAGGVGGTFCRRYVFQGGVSGYLSFSFVGGFVTFFGSPGVSPMPTSSWLSVVYVEQKDYDAPVFNLSVANYYVIEAYIEKGGLPIWIGHNSYLRTDWLRANNLQINSAYAALVEANSSISIEDLATMTVIGTAGAIEWAFDGATETTWPGAGTFVQKVDSFVSAKS